MICLYTSESLGSHRRETVVWFVWPNGDCYWRFSWVLYCVSLFRWEAGERWKREDLKGKKTGLFSLCIVHHALPFLSFSPPFFFFCVCLIQYVAKKKHFQPLYLKAFHKTGFWMCSRFLTHYSLTTRSTDVESLVLKFATVVTFTEAMPSPSITGCFFYFVLINQEKTCSIMWLKWPQ